MINQELLPQHIPEGLQGHRIDSALAILYPEHSRSRLTAWLKKDWFQVDGAHLKAKDKVLGGELIEWSGPSQSTLQSLSADACANLAQPLPLDIIYEDDDLLLVNKPAGLVVHPGAGISQNTLMNALLYYDSKLAQLPRAGIVHRLDKETTGLLLVAKTLESHTYFVRQLQERLISRQYLALVDGHVIAGSEIHSFYGRHPRNRLKMAVLQHGREAITRYWVEKQYGFMTLLRVELETGRTHQIRVHMDHIRHSVVGDPMYRGRSRQPAKIDPKLREHLSEFKRQALHAERLAFIHPRSQEELVFHAPLPEDFQVLLSHLDRFQDELAHDIRF